MPRERARMSVLHGETLSFMRRLWDLVHALEVRSKRMAKVLGVTGPQRLVIRVLGRSPGMTASELARTLGIHPSTLTGILGRLENQEMLIRRTDPDDRRRSRFELTRRGKKIDRERTGTVEAAVRRALARADAATIDKCVVMIVYLTDELSRES